MVELQAGQFKKGWKFSRLYSKRRYMKIYIIFWIKIRFINLSNWGKTGRVMSKLFIGATWEKQIHCVTIDRSLWNYSLFVFLELLLYMCCYILWIYLHSVTCKVLLLQENSCYLHVTSAPGGAVSCLCSFTLLYSSFTYVARRASFYTLSYTCKALLLRENSCCSLVTSTPGELFLALLL